MLFIPLYPGIYPADYSIRFSADPARRGVLLDRTLFCMSCSATGKATVFYFPAPRCGHRRLRVRRRNGTGPRCCRRSRRVLAEAAASAGAGRGEGSVGGSDEGRGVGYRWRWRASSDVSSSGWPVAAATPTPVVGCAAAGYRRRRRRQ